MGRPSEFTEEGAQAILGRLSAGEPLAQICRDDGMPHASTFRRWCESQANKVDGVSLAIAYAHARDDGFDAIALEALDIADDSKTDTRLGKDGQEMPDSEWISRSRLRVETRLKLLAKWDPKRYGEKTLVGSDPDNPLPSGLQISFVTPGAQETGVEE